MADRRRRDRDAERIRREAQVRRSERAVEAAATQALRDLTDLAARLLREGNYDPAVLDARHPEWSATLEDTILPAVTEAYIAGLAQEAAVGTFDATAYASRHLDTVRNRLVAVADSVFDVIRSELRVGYLQGEDIPTLTARVEAVLTDEQTWAGRARTIARTEVIGANNAGARDAARHIAGTLGHDPGLVVKDWLATSDNRTRETHAEANGQQVVGLDTTFDVGGYALQQPGDPAGPAEEVVNCRCTVLYLMPGDPGYPSGLAASGGNMPRPTVTRTRTATRPTVRPPVRRVAATDTQESLDAETQTLLDDTRPDAERAQEARDLLARYDAVGATPPPELVDLSTADQGDTPAPPQAAAVDAPAPDENGEVRWPFSGVMIVEGVTTGDGRKFTNMTWTAPPMTLRAQFSEQMGHDGAVAVGRIETINRTGSQIRYTGTWDDETLNPDAAEARRHNINGQMRGVSIDADEGTVSFEDGDGNPLDSEQLWDLGPEDPVVMAIDAARIRALTACMIPAFVEAYCLDDTVADQAPTDSVTAATGPTGAGLTAAAIMADPVVHGDAALASVFTYPGPETLAYDNGDPRGLTVTDDGRVYGYLATWGTCHIGIDGACVTPPQSATSYAYFLGGEYLTCDGQVVPVGQITMDTGHAGIELSAHATMAHYDNTGHAAADVAIGEDDTGIWFAGVIRDGLTPAKVRVLRAGGKTSGDWRRIGGNLELVAALAVNVPGFPIPRTQSRVASGAPLSLVASAVVADEHRDPFNPSNPDHLAALERELDARRSRRERREATAARLRRVKAATIRERLERARTR